MARHLVLALLLSRSAAALNFTYVGCVAADPRALMRVDPTPTCNDACAAEGSSFAAMAYDGCYCQHLTGPEAARMRMYAVAKESRCTTSCNATMGANLKCGNDEHQKKQRRRPFAFYKRQDPPQAKKELPGDLLKGKKELPADLLNGKDGLPTDLLKSTGLLPGDLLKTENGLPAELIKAKNSLPVDFLKSKDAESDDLLTDVGRKVLHLDQVLDGLDVPTQLVKPVQAVQTSKPGQPSQSILQASAAASASAAVKTH
ncbi:hypothetical protein CDD82_1222 [Ophiocordyceps australis]|uniref:WSC domain-containing protein n=1 Tax=Ophiocordyceps australis TaxID=1399860 RepID=A0A2C5YDV0_9HYPO|nr:hypothetical protein CDD82_1222 [Ophiocordyceps australis]